MTKGKIVKRLAEKAWQSRVHQRTSLEGSNFDKIILNNVRGSLRPNRGSGGGAEGQIHGSL